MGAPQRRTRTKKPAKNAAKKNVKLVENRRKHIRFCPDQKIVAEIDPTPKRTSRFTEASFFPTFAALVAEEGFKGCGIVAVASDLQVGDIVAIRVGVMKPMRAEVRWRVDLDSSTAKMGLMYLE